jgi:hypothetical protein
MIPPAINNDWSLTYVHYHGFLPDFSGNYNVVESTIYFLRCRTPAWDCHCLQISSFPSTSISSEVRHGRDISVPVWIYSSDTTQTPSNSSWAINRRRSTVGRKKYLWFRFPTDSYFFLPTLLFFQRNWPCDPIFSGLLQAAAKMASVVTRIIEKTMKKYF